MTKPTLHANDKDPATMAKTPSNPKAKGETAKKAPSLPPETELATSFVEPQGDGGETHQTSESGAPTLTTAQGAPVADDQNSLKQGTRGPTLLEDFHLREKIFHFDHERIPERVVHARGYGAHGFFELTDSLADITGADIFQRVGERTPAFVRFSTVAGSKGSAVPQLRRSGRRSEASYPPGKLRRSLQPGAAVLRQPDADRAKAYRRCARV
jgi:catalase